MTKLEIIESILHSKYIVKKDELCEKDKDKNGHKFEMKRKIVSQNKYSLYRYDDKAFPFFQDAGVTSLKKMCDYVLFVEDGIHLFVFLIELKKGTDSAKKQLEAGECFANYLIATINRLDLDFGVADDELHFRKIRISEKKSRKKILKKNIEVKENGVIEHHHSTSFHVENYFTF